MNTKPPSINRAKKISTEKKPETQSSIIMEADAGESSELQTSSRQLDNDGNLSKDQKLSEILMLVRQNAKDF